MVKRFAVGANGPWAIEKKDFLRLRTRIYVTDADRDPRWVFYKDREATAHEMSKLRKFLWGRE